MLSYSLSQDAFIWKLWGPLSEHYLIVIFSILHESISVGDIFSPALYILIASSNVNSSSTHISEVRILLDDKFLDVLAIQETTLDSSNRDSEFYIPGFDWVRRQ